MLLEAQVESTAGVLEAADSLVARDVQALWIGGDNIEAKTCLDIVRRQIIPVVVAETGRVAKSMGALQGVGAVSRLSSSLLDRMTAGYFHESSGDEPVQDASHECLIGQAVFNRNGLKLLQIS